MIHIKPKYISILAAFVAVVTIAFSLYLVNNYQSTTDLVESVETIETVEEVASTAPSTSISTTPIEPVVSAEPITPVVATPEPPATVQPKSSDLVKLSDYATIKIDDFYEVTPFSITENGTVVEKTIPYSDVKIKYGTLLKLKKAEALLNAKGYHIVLYCAYRDKVTQTYLRQHYENLTGDIGGGFNYVAKPGKSKHQSGQAVDLTIESLEGERHEPTPYLEFSEAVQVKNHTDDPLLQMLQKDMVDSGFTIYKGEWWHFNDTAVYK